MDARRVVVGGGGRHSLRGLRDPSPAQVMPKRDFDLAS